MRAPDQIYNLAPAVIGLDLRPSVQGQEPSAFSTPSKTSTEVNFGFNGGSEPPFNPKLHSTPKLDDTHRLSAGKTDSADLSPILNDIPGHQSNVSTPLSCARSTDTITSPVSHDAAVPSKSASASHSPEALCTDGVNTPKHPKSVKHPKQYVMSSHQENVCLQHTCIGVTLVYAWKEKWKFHYSFPYVLSKWNVLYMTISCISPLKQF